MFPLKLVRSLLSGDDVTTTTTTYNPLLRRIHNLDDDNPTCCSSSRNRIPLMLFLPTQELVKDTYRLASIARFIGMDLHPNPSLSHIIFSWPPSSTSTSSSSSSTSSSTSSSWSLRNDSVPIPFPSFATSSLSHLRLFAALSNGYFKLAFLKNNSIPFQKIESLSNNNCHPTSLSLFSTRTCHRIESMDRFNKALLGTGWTLFKTHNNNADKDSLTSEVYLYRKSDARRRICHSNTKQQPTTTTNRNQDDEECRVRELRLPTLDFGNAPLRILQYILLMTDDAFYLA